MRRRDRPNRALEKGFETLRAVGKRHESEGRWVGTLTELRAYLFMHWREIHWIERIPHDLTYLYDLLDTIRNTIAEERVE